MSAAPWTCGLARERVSLAVSHDLSATESRALWGHLAGCVACRRELSVYRELRDALDSLPGAVAEDGSPAGPGFFARLHDDILMATEDRGPVRAGPRRVGRVFAAAALFLVGLVLVQTGTIDVRGPTEPSNLLQRKGLEPGAATPSSPTSPRIPLSYEEPSAWGLEAQRESTDFETLDDPDEGVDPARSRRDRRRPRKR